jgi:hypothetical protein
VEELFNYAESKNAARIKTIARKGCPQYELTTK